MTDTPRTDDRAFIAQDRNGKMGECVTADFSRELEVSLSETQKVSGPFTTAKMRHFARETWDAMRGEDQSPIGPEEERQIDVLAEALATMGNASRVVSTDYAEELRGLLSDASEELRLIRMKDSPAVYDPTLRARIGIALAKRENEICHQRTTGADDHPDNASHSLREREEAGNEENSRNG